MQRTRPNFLLFEYPKAVLHSGWRLFVRFTAVAVDFLLEARTVNDRIIRKPKPTLTIPLRLRADFAIKPTVRTRLVEYLKELLSKGGCACRLNPPAPSSSFGTMMRWPLKITAPKAGLAMPISAPAPSSQRNLRALFDRSPGFVLFMASTHSLFRDSNAQAHMKHALPLHNSTVVLLLSLSLTLSNRSAAHSTQLKVSSTHVAPSLNKATPASNQVAASSIKAAPYSTQVATSLTKAAADPSRRADHWNAVAVQWNKTGARWNTSSKQRMAFAASDKDATSRSPAFVIRFKGGSRARPPPTGPVRLRTKNFQRTIIFTGLVQPDNQKESTTKDDHDS
ncbi:MAG: hypothetical protein ACOH13_00570 [Flavobacteriales bacterium]